MKTEDSDFVVLDSAITLSLLDLSSIIVYLQTTKTTGTGSWTSTAKVSYPTQSWSASQVTTGALGTFSQNSSRKRTGNMPSRAAVLEVHK